MRGWRERLGELREDDAWWRVPCAVRPAVPAALLLAAGIVVGLGWHNGTHRLLFLVAGGAFSALVVACATPCRLWRMLLLPLGMALALLHLTAPWDTVGSHLCARSCRARLSGVICDPHATGHELDPLPPPRTMVVRVQAVARPGERQLVPCRGKALIIIPPGASFEYGDVVLVDGAFLPAQKPLFEGAFDYGWYLRTKGILHTVQARSIRKIGDAHGWRRLIRAVLACRNQLAAALVKDIQSEDNAAVLLAMTFGFRRHLPPNVRRRFLRSGAIHIFAVSGLHVGIVAMLIGGAMKACGLSYRWRCLCTPCFLGVYVIMTGASASSVRAWTMLSFAGVALWRDRRLCPVNIVAAAALVLLCLNPLSLFQSGFLFSFTIVTMLVAGWPPVSHVAAVLCERDLWVPRRLRPRWRRPVVRRTVQAVGASLLAWFGSAGLVAYVNGLVVPGALLVNMILSVLAYAIIALAVPKAMLSALPISGLGECLGIVLGAMLDLLLGLVDLGSRHPASLSVAKPGLTAVCGYYALLVGAMAMRNARLPRIACVCLAALWIVGLCVRPRRHPVLAIFHGNDCDQPVVLMERRHNLPPVLVFSGTYLLHRDLQNWLQARGHRELDVLVVPWTAGRGDSSAPLTVDLLDVNTLVTAGRRHRRGALATAEKQQQRVGARVRAAIEKMAREDTTSAHAAGIAITIRTQKTRRIVEIRDDAGDDPITLAFATSGLGPASISLWRRDSQSIRLKIMPRLHRRLVTVPIP